LWGGENWDKKKKWGVVKRGGRGNCLGGGGAHGDAAV